MGTPSNDEQSPTTSPPPAAPPPGATRSPTATRPLPKAAPVGSTAIRPAPRTGTPAGRPPVKGPARAPPKGPAAARRRGRVFWAFLIAGLILAATGGTLWATFYPDVVNAQSASAFLGSAHATFAPSNSIPIVELSGSNIKVGNTVVIQDTVTSAI